MGLGLWRIRRKVGQWILGPHGETRPRRNEILTAKIRDLAALDAGRVATRFYRDFYGEKEGFEAERIHRVVAEFFELFARRPIEVNYGGSGFENLFWLYVTGRLLEPELVVESGVWRGQSSWVLRQACPMAEFHAFDIDLSRLAYRDDSIVYHEQDWSTFDFGDVSDRSTLAFFDDHVDQKRRIDECAERGFDTLIFDDNLPVYHIHRETSTIVPTVDMLFDDDLQDGDEIEWLHNDRPFEARVDLAAWRSTRAKVRNYANFPLVDNLAENAATKARYGGHTKTALVTLL